MSVVCMAIYLWEFFFSILSLPFMCLLLFLVFCTFSVVARSWAVNFSFLYSLIFFTSANYSSASSSISWVTRSISFS